MRIRRPEIGCQRGVEAGVRHMPLVHVGRDLGALFLEQVAVADGAAAHAQTAGLQLEVARREDAAGDEDLAPARVASMCNAVARYDLKKARDLHFELFELNQAIFLDTNPIPLKYMMWRLNLLETPEVRLPLAPLVDDDCKKLDDVLGRARLFDVTQAVSS